MGRLPFLWRKRAFRLDGLVASPEGLYDGSFIAACAAWWNDEVERSGRMRAAGHRPFTDEDVQRLAGVVQPENRLAFATFAENLSVPGTLASAILCLAYAFALVADAGASQTRGDAHVTAAWSRARPFRSVDLTELRRHYSAEGATRGYEVWAPFWLVAASCFGDRVGPRLIASLRATFADQVARWDAAEGSVLQKEIGTIDYSLVAFSEDGHVGFSSFAALLLEWGGRLRVGERFLISGVDLSGERFGQLDDSGLIDQQYDETLERYSALASRDEPVDEDVEAAVASCVAWLGDGLTESERRAVSVAATRAYLWRAAHEHVAYELMEPELSEAIARSREIGAGRGPDEPFWLTLYYAASQCMTDGVKSRFGSLGGWLSGPKVYERAFYDLTDDFAVAGLELDEATKRQAFQFGVCLADVERQLTAAPAA
jgi:hypothetical protein